MKLPQTILSRIQRTRADDPATPNLSDSRHWALRRPGKQQAAIGLAALAAVGGIVAGTVLGLSGGGAQGTQDNLGAGAQQVAMVSSGSAPQLHVNGNHLVNA